MSKNVDTEFPSEIKKQVKDFHDALVNIKETLHPLIENYKEIKEKAKMPEQEAKLDLTIAYSLNSLFWMYLITMGENPRNHDIKRELDRLKSSMTRLKELEDKSKAPKLDVSAAKRFINHSLTDPESKMGPPSKKHRK